MTVDIAGRSHKATLKLEGFGGRLVIEVASFMVLTPEDLLRQHVRAQPDSPAERAVMVAYGILVE